MTTTLRSTRLVIGILAALFTAGLVLLSFSQEPIRAQPSTAPSIVELLQVRRNLLADVVRLQTQAYHRGEAEIVAVLDSQRQLLAARLELAADHAERQSVLQESVHLAAELRKAVEVRYEADDASMADVLLSHAEYLRAETDLLRERQMAD